MNGKTKHLPNFIQTLSKKAGMYINKRPYMRYIHLIRKDKKKRCWIAMEDSIGLLGVLLPYSEYIPDDWLKW